MVSAGDQVDAAIKYRLGIISRKSFYRRCVLTVCDGKVYIILRLDLRKPFAYIRNYILAYKISERQNIHLSLFPSCFLLFFPFFIAWQHGSHTASFGKL